MGVGKLVGSELNDGAMASRTEGLLVAEVGDDGLRPEDDVFLKMLGDVVHGGESVRCAMRTTRWSRNVHDLVDMIGRRAKPAGMSHGGAALPGRRVVAVGGGRVCGVVVGALLPFLDMSLFLELLPVECNELGAESVVFGFEFLDAIFGLSEELIQVVDLVPELPVLFAQMAILRSDPLGGQSVEVGTATPMGAVVVPGGLVVSGHEGPNLLGGYGF
jgi:hypothetical protein